MRALSRLVLSAALAVLFAGCDTRACRKGTLFLEVRLGSLVASELEVAVDWDETTANPQRFTQTLMESIQGTTTIEVRFPDGVAYPTGKQFKLQVVARNSAERTIGAYSDPNLMFTSDCFSSVVDFVGSSDMGADGPVAPCVAVDTDHDGIADNIEGEGDPDGDEIPNRLDDDSDGDGIPDSVESGTDGNACAQVRDSDDDGVPDYLDLDSDSADNSTVGDREEAGPNPAVPVDTDNDGVADYRDDDNDGDGISDVVELTPPGSIVAATALSAAPDTDGDTFADFVDRDSDNDTIRDDAEGAVDTDGDTTPNYRDLDSDGDCILDAMEAGDSDPNTKPVDTDSDGVPDFEDLDSDNDGLRDASEDVNCDGMVSACESSRLLVDTDGDDTNDFVETLACQAKTAAERIATACDCDAADIAKSPTSRGELVFVVDYQAPPSPASMTTNLTTELRQVDVVFVLDITGSMANPVSALATGFNGLVTTLRPIVSDIAFGAFGFRDYNESTKFSYVHRIQTTRTQAGIDSMKSALQAITVTGGGDAPEAGWSAIWALTTSMTRMITITGGSMFTLGSPASSAPPSVPTTGEEQGALLNAGFRVGSLPVFVTMTDVEWHDAPGVTASGENGRNNYGPSTDCDPCTNVPARSEAIDAMLAIGGRVIGLGIGVNAKSRATATAQATSAVVKPSHFGTTGRPSGCNSSQCCTGQAGAGESPIGGDCPLGFTTMSDGSGVVDATRIGLLALTSGLNFSTFVRASDIDSSAVFQFMDKLELSLAPNSDGCITSTPSPLQDNFVGPKALDLGTDGEPDTFPGIVAGSKVCFSIHAKQNTAVMRTSEPQIFRAQVAAKGRANTNVINLGTPKTVVFLVPPAITNGPIE